MGLLVANPELALNFQGCSQDYGYLFGSPRGEDRSFLRLNAYMEELGRVRVSCLGFVLI